MPGFTKNIQVDLHYVLKGLLCSCGAYFSVIFYFSSSDRNEDGGDPRAEDGDGGQAEHGVRGSPPEAGKGMHSRNHSDAGKTKNQINLTDPCPHFLLATNSQGCRLGDECPPRRPQQSMRHTLCSSLTAAALRLQLNVFFIFRLVVVLNDNLLLWNQHRNPNPRTLIR